MASPGKIPSDCMICGGRLEHRFGEVPDPLTGETFAIDRCVRCGLGHTVPHPPDPDRYYPPSYYGKRHGFTIRYCVKRRLRFVAAAVPDGAGKRLLDIGCGDGSFLLAAREAGWEVVGTELNPGPGRDAGLEVKESLESIPDDSAFDCITMWHTLEHMPEIRPTLSHVARLLKSGGHLIIAVPDFGGLQASIFGPEWLHADVPRHLYHFDEKALRHGLAMAGFSVRRTWHQELEYDLLGWSQSALNLLGARTNVFFDFLRGQESGGGGVARILGIALGAMLTVLSLPALAAGTVSGRGGTLVVMADRPRDGGGTG